MRIGIFTDTYTPDINGVVSSVVTLERGLQAAGHEVYIVTGQKNSLHAHGKAMCCGCRAGKDSKSSMAIR